MPHIHKITETSPLLHDANCVYCHVDLELNDHVVACDECSSPHHQECWQGNNNHCATFGCAENEQSTTMSMNESLQTHHNNSQSTHPVPSVNSPSNSSPVSDLARHILLRFLLPAFILIGGGVGLIQLSALIGIPDMITVLLLMVVVASSVIVFDIFDKKS